MQNETEELKPCPFCGAQVRIRLAQCNGEYPFISHAPKIGGNQCGMEGFSSFNVGDEDEATLVGLWNTRARAIPEGYALVPVVEREAIARAIKWADDEFGYSLRLTKLLDGEEEHTLTYADGSEPLIFSDTSDAYQHIAEHRSQVRADAILALLNPPAKGDGGEG